MLTLQFVPYGELAALKPAERIRKIIKMIKEEKIILMEGQLKMPEEAELIRMTMEEIDDKFKGLEIANMDIADYNTDFLEKMRSRFINILLGNRRGFTIIGPATIVKEIKKDPNKIQLFTTEAGKKRRK